MIESGPEQTAEAAWAALERANASLIGMSRTGQEGIDRAVLRAHLQQILRAAVKHAAAVADLLGSVGD